MYLRKIVIITVFVMYMPFESYTGTIKFINSTWYTESLYQHFSDILIVLKDPRFKCCEGIFTIDFSLSLEIKSLDILS